MYVYYVSKRTNNNIVPAQLSAGLGDLRGIHFKPRQRVLVLQYNKFQQLFVSPEQVCEPDASASCFFFSFSIVLSAST